MDDPEDEMFGMDEDQQEMEQEPHTGELTQAQRDNIREIYYRYDLDKSGALSLKELRKCLQVLGLNPSVKETKDIMKKHNITEKNVSYEKFEGIMKEELLAKTNQEFDLLEAFRVFDKDQNGTLDKQELKQCLQCLGEKFSDDEVEDLFRCLDTNKDGVLSYIEAAKLLA